MAAILSAYAAILAELDLISWRIWRFPLYIRAKNMAGGIFVLSLLMLIVDREGPVTHSAIPGGLACGLALLQPARVRLHLVAGTVFSPSTRSRSTCPGHDARGIHRTTARSDLRENFARRFEKFNQGRAPDSGAGSEKRQLIDRARSD